MSYDIFCYRSKTGMPDEDEANEVIEADNNKWVKKDRNADTKLSIVKALIQSNPKLEAFDFDYGEIAKLSSITIEEAKSKFDHIELNAADGEPAIQLTVYDNHVFITIPYWYNGKEAETLFGDLKRYIKIINEIAGYFVLDPQAGQAFDPAQNDFEGFSKYLSVSEYVQGTIGKKAVPELDPKKPWWKFW